MTMEILDAPVLSANSCTSCKQNKRKCNRIRPTCSTCSRVGRTCHYDEDTHSLLQQAPKSHHSQSLPSRSDDSTTAHSNGRSCQGQSPNILFTFPSLNVDPFRYEALRQPTVNVAISNEATKILGTRDEIHIMALKYFDTIGRRIPMISRSRFFDRLPTFTSSPQASFIVLCLCMHLTLQSPSPEEKSMQSSLYVMTKSYICLLESTSFMSLEIVQSRLLVTLYEIGHRIHPGASISIASCARIARLLGLNKKCFQRVSADSVARIAAEEEKRVWWSVIILDRFINFCNGDALFTTEDPHSDDLLPIEDKMWEQDVITDTLALPLTTPSDIRVGPFARECQISHLTGRVLQHVFNPASNPEFHAQEAIQLERTLLAFIPLLIEEQTKYGLYCAALGMCSSALFTLYDSALFSRQNDEAYRASLLKSIEMTSTRIAEFSRHLFDDPESVNLHTVSPLIPHSLYQAAIIQFRCLKQTNEMRHRNAFDSLREILAFFNQRWLIGGRYLEALQSITESSTTMLPLHGFYVSAYGLTG